MMTKQKISILYTKKLSVDPIKVVPGLHKTYSQKTLKPIPVEVSGHEDTGTALLGGALTPQTVDLAVVVDLDLFSNFFIPGDSSHLSFSPLHPENT